LDFIALDLFYTEIALPPIFVAPDAYRPGFVLP